MQYSYNIIVDSPCEITADFAKANQLKVLHFTYTEGNGDEDDAGSTTCSSRVPLTNSMRRCATAQLRKRASLPSMSSRARFAKPSSRAFQQSILPSIQVFRAATKVLAWHSIV